MRLGYNTNGTAHHELQSAIDLLAEIGYESVAITLDHSSLNPFSPDLTSQLSETRRRLQRYGMGSVVETGARFLLDPRVKHEPTLVSALPEERDRRIEFLCRAIDIAAELGSDCVSCWSGVVRDSAAVETVWQRLIPALQRTLEHAARRDVVLGFEPEPGMFIDTMARFAELQARVNARACQLTLDVGHLHCLGELPIADQVREWGRAIVNVHLEDMRAGVHEHLMFGEGEMEFRPILSAFAEVGYGGGLHVELSRHSHDAPQAARRAWEYLVARMPGGNLPGSV